MNRLLLFGLLSTLFLFSGPKAEVHPQYKFNTLRNEQQFKKILPDLNESNSLDTLIKRNNDLILLKFFEVTIKGKNVIVTLEIKNSNVISHIGLYLFSRNKPLIDHDIAHFLERVLLDHLSEDHEIAFSKSRTENISIILNGLQYGCLGFTELNSIFDVLYDNESFILKKKNLLYSATWRNKYQDQLDIVFPARFDLISGKDKKELDELLIAQITSFEFKKNSKKPFNYPVTDSGKIEILKDSIYVLRGNEFFKGLNSNRYLTKRGQRFTLLDDLNYLEESTSNLFLEPDYSGSPITVNLTFMSQSGKKEPAQLLLKNLIKYFQYDYDAYIGFENSSPDTIKTIIVFVSKKYTHLHLMRTDIPTESVFSSEPSTVNAKLNTNIRFDNVKEIFAKYIRRNTQKVPIKVEN